MKRGKRQIQPVSETRFRVVLVLMALVLLLGVFMVLDGSAAVVWTFLIPALIVSPGAPESFLRSVDGKIPLLRLRMPLFIVAVFAVVGGFVLLHFDQNILAAALFLVGNLGFFFAMLGETIRNRIL